MLTKDNNMPVTINRRNPALQDNRRACPRRDTERRKFQRNNPASGSDNAEKQHRLVGVSGHIYILSKREEVKQHIKSVIASEADSWGIEVMGV
jgi:hypothetical protein